MKPKTPQVMFTNSYIFANAKKCHEHPSCFTWDIFAEYSTDWKSFNKIHFADFPKVKSFFI